MEWTMILLAPFLWANARWMVLNRMRLLARSAKLGD
jgi:hypothetical protein